MSKQISEWPYSVCVDIVVILPTVPPFPSPPLFYFPPGFFVGVFLRGRRRLEKMEKMEETKVEEVERKQNK